MSVIDIQPNSIAWQKAMANANKAKQFTPLCKRNLDKADIARIKRALDRLAKGKVL